MYDQIGHHSTVTVGAISLIHLHNRHFGVLGQSLLVRRQRVGLWRRVVLPYPYGRNRLG